MASKQKTSRKTSSRAPRGKNAAALKQQREIVGVLEIAAGVLMGVYMFASGTGMLGKVLMQALFGLFGRVAYVLPIVLIAVGILSIRGSSRDNVGNTGWFAILGVLNLVTLFQVIYHAPYEGVKYMEYIHAARTAALEAPHRGGGVVGAILCYLLEGVGGQALSYTVTIALIIVSVIAITGLSLRDTAKNVSESVRDAAEQAKEAHQEQSAQREEKRRLYTATLADKVDKLAGRIGGQDASVIEEPSVIRGKKKKKDAKSLSDTLEETLSVMPTQGELKKKPIPQPRYGDLEPEDDVPLIIEPVGGKGKPDPAPLPNTQALFGSQEGDAPVKPKRAGKAKDALDPVLPQLGAAAGNGAYEPPSTELLNRPFGLNGSGGENPNEVARKLVECIADFGIQVKVSDICIGPVLTRYELQPAKGVRVNRITALADDICLNLAANHVRIEAPIPGKSAVGVEVPNKHVVTVVLREIVESREFQIATSPITMAMGKDVSGHVITADLAKMPHMLIAGATGSGKSVCINDIIISMVYKSSPADLRMILIDPKKVELSVYGNLPHLLIPVVTDPKKAAGALRWATNEMDMRYNKFNAAGARDLIRYNDLQTEPEARLPRLVIIIDELADLMMVAPTEVEDAVCRIAQLGRASGIHLIVATQRPSVDVITGLIKANIPSRCAFAVSSAIDSRIILDSTGAEQLLGKGDMLFHPNGASKPSRGQCAFVSDEEVERVVRHFQVQQAAPAFDEELVEQVENQVKAGPVGGAFGEGKQEDELLEQTVRTVMEAKQASISLIQRKLRVGYTRAARLMDIMESKNFVSKSEGSKSRRVLITPARFQEEFGGEPPVVAEGEPVPEAME